MSRLIRAVAAAARSRRPCRPSPAIVRPYCTGASGCRTQLERVAGEMIRYALVDARSRNPGDERWLEEATRILEQGLSSLGGGEGGAKAVGMLMLAIATLSYERNKLQDAIEKLHIVFRTAPSFKFRVAAWEGLMGLQIEAGQDVSLEDSWNTSKEMQKGSEFPESEILSLRAVAARGLAHLVNGDTESAKSSFERCLNCETECSKADIGNAVLSCAEHLHCSGEFTLAKSMYRSVLEVFEREGVPEWHLAAANMVPEETSLAATCSLAQLLSYSGQINEAEELLTRALTKAESHFGSSHPKVGIVLICLARMYKQKARSEASSSILVQEGLYRKALELLKAPSISSEGAANMQARWMDLFSLARGGYAELLLIQSKRKGEGERMMKSAESAWRNRRLSLSEALELQEPTADSGAIKVVPVIDTRICRVL